MKDRTSLVDQLKDILIREALLDSERTLDHLLTPPLQTPNWYDDNPRANWIPRTKDYYHDPETNEVNTLPNWITDPRRKNLRSRNRYKIPGDQEVFRNFVVDHFSGLNRPSESVGGRPVDGDAFTDFLNGLDDEVGVAPEFGREGRGWKKRTLEDTRRLSFPSQFSWKSSSRSNKSSQRHILDKENTPPHPTANSTENITTSSF